MQPSSHQLVGRELELGTVETFLLDGQNRASALVLDGPAGIGKTSVWEAGVALARERGLTTLVARASPEDARLALVGLGDMFEGLPTRVLEELPQPQRRALDSALLVGEDEAVGHTRAMYLAVLSVLRQLAADGRTIVAVDDVQWLDEQTSGALAFAARRLQAADVRLLLTRRDRTEHPLEARLPVERLTVGPLSFGAVTKVIHDRLGIMLTRANARWVYDAAQGNPLFGLELARVVAERGDRLDTFESFALPERIDSLLAERVAGLPAAVQMALLAVALSPGAKTAEISQVVGEDVVDDAIQSGLIIVDGEHTRLAHPLFGEAARSRGRASERRALHARLAAVTSDEQRRAWHLAQATPGPDARVAETVARAAENAANVGAVAMAVELAEKALTLTAADDPGRNDRLLDVAEINNRAGRLSRVDQLLGPVLQHLPEGSSKARAMHLLSSASSASFGGWQALLTNALLQERARTPLRAEILTHLAHDLAVGAVEQLDRAAELAGEALEIARETASVPQQRHALGALMWVRAMQGESLADLAVHAALPDAAARIYHDGERIVAVAAMWRGEIGDARRRFAALLRLADERGESESYLAIRLQLCELELRAGRWEAVEVLLEEWETELAEPEGSSAALLRCRALLAARRGDPETALQAAARAIESADEVGAVWHRLEAMRARGLAELVMGEPGSAAASFGEVWRHLRANGVKNLGAFPVAPDLVQALVSSGSLGEAATVAETLATTAEAQDHLWTRAAAVRAQGLVMLAEGDAEAAADRFTEATERFSALDFAFDRARCLGELGLALRRLRRKREARATLQTAVHELAQLGSDGWASRLQAELQSISGRRPSAQAELTPTERRVAELVARGLPNKQVAASLVVTVSAVEAHLTRIYAKLGVRSRIELVRRLDAGGG